MDAAVKPKVERKKLLSLRQKWEYRITKMSPEMKQLFVSNILVGLPIQHCCALAGISENCFYDWMKDGERYLTSREPNPNHEDFAEFYLAIQEARAEWQKEILLRSFQGAKFQPNWVRDMTLLERRDRVNWGRNDWANSGDRMPDSDMKYL